MSATEYRDGEDIKPNIGGGPDNGADGDKASEEYVRSLIEEMDDFDAESYPIIRRLITQELTNISRCSAKEEERNVNIDLMCPEPISLYVKAMLPTPSKSCPKINYIGRILGPKGSFLKALKTETKTSMAILGRGAMKDAQKEDKLRRGKDPKDLHLHEDMHVAIQVKAPAAEAYSRISYALKCLKLQMFSENNGLDLPWIVNASKYVGRGGFRPGGSNCREHTVARPCISSPQGRVEQISYRTYLEYPTDSGQGLQPLRQQQQCYAAVGYDSSRLDLPVSQQSLRAVTVEWMDRMRIPLSPYSGIGGQEQHSFAKPGYNIGQDPALPYTPENTNRYEASKIFWDRGGKQDWGLSSQSSSQRYSPYGRKY